MQFTLKVANDTWFTQSKVDPKDLSESEKTFVTANTEFPIVACSLNDSWLQVTLSKPLKDSTQWFVKASGTLSLTSTTDQPTAEQADDGTSVMHPSSRPNSGDFGSPTEPPKRPLPSPTDFGSPTEPPEPPPPPVSRDSGSETEPEPKRPLPSPTDSGSETEPEPKRPSPRDSG